MFIQMFLGSAMSVSERVGIRTVWNLMFLGSAVSVLEQVSIRPMFIHVSRKCDKCV